MCQGVIASLAKFVVDGNVKRIVISGIGSHMQLYYNNLAMLRAAGWTCRGEDRAVAIESDFSKGWNSFTVEEGIPDEQDLLLLSQEYERCAGNAEALIAHVTRVGQIDEALRALLTEEARIALDAEIEKVQKERKWKRALAYEKYLAEDIAIRMAFRREISGAHKVEEELIRGKYLTAHAANRKVYDEVDKDLVSSCQAKIASIWAQLFKEKQNRINILQ